MQLEDLLLRKEELPISLSSDTNRNTGFRVPIFRVPIYPRLISSEVSLDPKLADGVFEEAARQWYEDLKLYLDSQDSKPERDWTNETFYKKGLKIEKRGEVISINNMWENMTTNFGNGFVDTLSINRNVGGTLFIIIEKIRPQYIGKPEVLFSKEKFRLYKGKDIDWDFDDSTAGYSYDRHNIDNYPGALFLRNWAILYLNEAIKNIKPA